MKYDKRPSLEEIPAKDHTILVKQQLEYQQIRDQGGSIMQFVLAVISLVVSIGFLQFLTTGGAIQRSSIGIFDEAVNRCSPEALTHSGMSLEGVGILLSFSALGMLFLSLYLVFESWLANRVLQNLPASLYPRHEADRWIGTYQEWVTWNQRKITESQQLLDSIQRNIRYSVGLSALSLVLTGLLYLNHPIPAFVLGVFLIVLGLGLVSKYVKQYFVRSGPEYWGRSRKILFSFMQLSVGVTLFIGAVFIVDFLSMLQFAILSIGVIIFSLFLSVVYPWLAKGSSDGIFEVLDSKMRVFYFRDRRFSLVFLCLSVLLLAFMIGQYYKVYLLLDYFLIC
jgi:hypothetical protein